MNGFETLSGDLFDSVMVTTINEHWFNVFRGKELWNQVSYFYPHTNTLGHTDGYLGTGLIYSIYRLVGASPLISLELTNLTLHIFTFLAFFLLCRSWARCSFAVSLSGSWLLVLMNNYTLHTQRIQLSAIALALWIVILLLRGQQSFNFDKKKSAHTYFILAITFYGILSLTAFYIFWFSSLFFVIYLGVELARNRRLRLQQLRSINISVTWIALYATLFILSLTPTAYVYLNKRTEVGDRSWSMVSSNTIRFWDNWQIGSQNFFWQDNFQKFILFFDPNYAILGEYTSSGIEIITFLVFLFAAYKVWQHPLVFSKYRTLIVSFFICLFLVQNINGFSAWRIVYELIPGAKTINVVNVMFYVLVVPLVVVIVVFVNSLKLKAGYVVALFAFLSLIQLNEGYQKLDTNKVYSIVDSISSPPKDCKNFFVGQLRNQESITDFPEYINDFYAHNVIAMYIGSKFSLPTLNGIASYNPPDWNFANPSGSDYSSRVEKYLRNYGITQTCFLDFKDNSWIQISFSGK